MVCWCCGNVADVSSLSCGVCSEQTIRHTFVFKPTGKREDHCLAHCNMVLRN
jgi:hypothetical protein